MFDMFSACILLTEIDLSKFKTDNVINMDSMFSGCDSLNKINFS